MTAGPAHLNLNVNRPTGANITGNLVLAMNLLISLLTGQDFVRDALGAVNGRDFALNAPINYEMGKLLAGKVKSGVAIRPGFDNRYGRITLTLEDEGKAPVVR